MQTRSDFAKPHIGVFDCIREGWQIIRAHYWLFLGITLVGLLVAGAVPLYILLGPMQCGIFICLRKRMKGETVGFGDLFLGFNFFSRSLLATLIVTAPLLLSTIVMFATILPGMLAEMVRGRQYEMPPETMILLFVEIAATNIVYMVVQGLAMFANLLIVDRQMQAWDAIKLSSRAVWHNAWGITLLLLGQGLVTALGFLCCVVGVYFVLPVVYASVLVAYSRIFGLSALSPTRPA